MRHEEHLRALGGALAAYGLDLGRYSPAHAHGYLSRFPDPIAWSESEARASLVSTFAIGETTFMRHPEQFALLRALAPELGARRAGPLRVWSAGCASGEEAYSLAASLAVLGRGSYDLVAWDLNPEAIARARLGEYRPWSLRGVDARSTEGWLEPSPCGVCVASWLRDGVRFEVANLFVDEFPRDLDLIFCRNVLLYFRPDAAAQVFAGFAQSLRPGGVLVLGHYDPRPTHIAGLVQEMQGDVVYYRKLRSDLPAATARSRLSLPPSALVPVSAGRVLGAPGAPGSMPEATMQLVRLLANQRQLPQALRALEELAAATPLAPDVHVLTALVAEDAGNVRLMLQAARKACFLVPEHAGPNYFLSVAFARNGELRRAALHRRIAAQALRRADQLSTVLDHSEGLTVGQLRRLIGAIAR